MIRGAHRAAVRARACGACFPAIAGGGEGLLPVGFRKRQSGFVHLLRATRRFRAPAGARATFSLRAQRESSQRERAPRGGAFRPSMDGKSVRRGRAFRPDSCPVEKASPSLASPAARPDRPRLTATEGPRNSSALPARRCNSQGKAERGQSEALQGSASSVSRYGAVWPPRRSCRRESLQHPRLNTVCNSGGLNQAISLGYFSLGQQREVTRAPGGDRKPAAGEPKCGTERLSRAPAPHPSPLPRGEREKKQVAAGDRKLAAGEPSCGTERQSRAAIPHPTHLPNGEKATSSCDRVILSPATGQKRSDR